MAGEYAKVSQNESIFQQHISESVVANQRLRYTDAQQTNTMGSYIGQTLELKGNRKKEALR